MLPFFSVTTLIVANKWLYFREADKTNGCTELCTVCTELWIFLHHPDFEPEKIKNVFMAKKRSGTDKLPFGKILKSIMEERDLSVRAIAEMAGVRPSVVQNWLSSANPHDLQSVSKLAKALNIEFKKLLLGESDSEINVATTAQDFFDEKEFFEGICKISIQRLIPKKGK